MEFISKGNKLDQQRIEKAIRRYQRGELKKPPCFITWYAHGFFRFVKVVESLNSKRIGVDWEKQFCDNFLRPNDLDYKNIWVQQTYEIDGVQCTIAILTGVLEEGE